jgi:ribonuclease T2
MRFFIVALISFFSTFAVANTCVKLPGKAQGNVLAVVWFSGFCAKVNSRGSAPFSCLRPQSAFGSRFTLHGLWPIINNKDCRYNFCGHSSFKSRQHWCEYPALSLHPDVASELAFSMPSYNPSECLERYEWNKHGLCQLRGVNQYFSLALALLKQINRSKFTAYIHRHAGDKVPIKNVRLAFDQSFGHAMHKKMQLVCYKKHLLTEIRISLPKLPATSIPSLKTILPLGHDAAEANKYNVCQAYVTISNYRPKS